MRANRMAYESLMRCFVANAHAGDERQTVGDTAKAASYRAKARKSFDLAYAAGEKIGLSDDKISRDLDYAQATELPHLISDQHYQMDTASTCKALGLM